MNTVQDALAMLGFIGEDRITGLTGVVASVSFDLYGCVQVILNPGLDKDGKVKEAYWMDAKRVKLQPGKRVMDPPDFMATEAEKEKGSADKPVGRI